jgi:hypothetical protein
MNENGDRDRENVVERDWREENECERMREIGEIVSIFLPQVLLQSKKHVVQFSLALHMESPQYAVCKN